MKSRVAAMLTVVVTATAQAHPATAAGRAKPKPPAATAASPAAQTPAETMTAMTAGERRAIQSDLAWVGRYNGIINGDVSDRMVAAIKAFQKDHHGKQTGVLNPQERVLLAEAAKKLQAAAGWKIVTDSATGARLGLPLKLVPQQTTGADSTKWASPSGAIQIVFAHRTDGNTSIAKLADQEKKEPSDRKVDYSAVKPDFFVLSGTQGLKTFYVRGQFSGGEARTLTVLYEPAAANTMAPVVIAMSSAFNPFPPGASARKTVDYGTGIVVNADGTIVTSNDMVEGCQSIVVGGHGRADKVATNKARDLALLRIYGAQGLTPVPLAGGVTTSAVNLIGIADPAAQGGGTAVSSVAAQITSAGNGNELMLSPAPGAGFSGAAALDANEQLAGLALLKPVTDDGAPTTQATQARFVKASVLGDFLRAHKIAMATGPADARAAVVRVICVRK